MKNFLLLTTICSLVLVNPSESSADETTNFIIDPVQSYVSAYVPGGWINDGYTWDYSAVVWRQDWVLANFQMAGSFTVKAIPSGSNPDWYRLYLEQNNVITDAPGYASFYMPDFFSVLGDFVSYSDHPCFDTGFYDPPGWTSSCTGFSVGKHRSDDGILMGGRLTLDGEITDDFQFWGPNSNYIVLPFGDEPDPGFPIDYSNVTGLFQYHMVAVAEVPEPEIFSLMIAGLGLLSYAASRRKSV